MVCNLQRRNPGVYYLLHCFSSVFSSVTDSKHLGSDDVQFDAYSLYSVKKTSVRRVLNGAKKPSVQYLQSRLTNLTQSLLLVSHTFKNKRTCIIDVTMRTNSKHLYLFYEWIHAVLSIEFMYWGSLTKC